MIFSPHAINVKVVPMSEVPKAEESLSGNSQTVVLIVDDERLIADTLSAIFTKSGFTALTAYDGASALELAKSGAPAVLITDVSMPGMNGVELAVAVMQARPACKVLLFSAHAAAADMVTDACEEGHEFLFMTKPVHPAVMITQVSKLVAA